MPSLLVDIWAGFWSPSFWLPANTTWHDLQSTGTMSYSSFTFVCLAVLLSAVVTFARYLVERYIFTPFAISRGLKAPRAQFVPNDLLEEAYRKSTKGFFPADQVTYLAKKLDWSERQVERWIFKRRVKDKPSAIVKLTESGWRFTYYSSLVIFGLYILWDKPWMWKLDECWINYPHQNLTTGVALYYMIQLSCYWSMMFSQFQDVKRKDFLEMFVHHVVTIALISFSWIVNLVRIGSLILILHDVADVFMEAAKICKYARWQRACDALFAFFVVVWSVSRLFIFPFYILKSLIFESKLHFDTYPALNMLIAFLLVLQTLHVIWTCFIAKIVYRTVLAGKMEKDSRSSSSEMSEGEK